ncbi:MAG: glycosyltransferase [Candidatus Jorgensenbacteria bacterium]
MAKHDLKFSIVTPSYNEEKDIRETIENFIGLSYPNKEIIVVDDSTDRTPEIIREYASRGVRLINGPRKGCCEAVNLGITQATGDIIVYADADVRPPRDFLERLAEKYEAGADWVLVDSHIPNTRSAFSRFVGALHVADHTASRGDVYYSEAASYRRDLAIKLGMFGPTYPARFCRDWLLGKKLTEGGYKKVYDPSIVVQHPQPDNFKEYWYVRKARGRFGPFKQYFMDAYPLPLLFFKLLAKDAVFALRFLLIIPATQRVIKISRRSKNGLKDFFPFLYAYFIQELARCVGEWEGWRFIVRYRREQRADSRIARV